MQIVHHLAAVPHPVEAEPPPAPPVHQHYPPARGKDLAKLALGAIGVVYGDIGTSPLYALKECVTMPHGVVPASANSW